MYEIAFYDPLNLSMNVVAKGKFELNCYSQALNHLHWAIAHFPTVG